jgi:hypothetical protein
MKINMKNFIYYNSVAAHPHHLMGYNGRPSAERSFEALDIRYIIGIIKE